MDYFTAKLKPTWSQEEDSQEQSYQNFYATPPNEHLCSIIHTILRGFKMPPNKFQPSMIPKVSFKNPTIDVESFYLEISITLPTGLVQQTQSESTRLSTPTSTPWCLNCYHSLSLILMDQICLNHLEQSFQTTSKRYHSRANSTERNQRLYVHPRTSESIYPCK